MSTVAVTVTQQGDTMVVVVIVARNIRTSIQTKKKNNDNQPFFLSYHNSNSNLSMFLDGLLAVLWGGTHVQVCVYVCQAKLYYMHA